MNKCEGVSMETELENCGSETTQGDKNVDRFYFCPCCPVLRFNLFPTVVYSLIQVNRASFHLHLLSFIAPIKVLLSSFWLLPLYFSP